MDDKVHLFLTTVKLIGILFYNIKLYNTVRIRTFSMLISLK